MIQTRNNLIKNNKVALLAFESNYSYCIKIDAIAKYQTSGKCFELIKSLKTNKSFDCKGAVVLKVKKVQEVC
jgi:hypothetical protein